MAQGDAERPSGGRAGGTARGPASRRQHALEAHGE